MTAIVPNHGGTPAEMLRDLADFLDRLDEFGKKAVLPDGTLLYDIFNAGDEDAGTMQADVRWLADRLDENGSANDECTRCGLRRTTHPNNGCRGEYGRDGVTDE